MPSFDVVSEIDMQEVKNALDQVRREMVTRYDFKGSKASVELEENIIIILADDNVRLKSLQELLRQKLAKRNVSLKLVEFRDPKPASGDMQRQEVAVKQGLTDEELRRLTKMIKKEKFKVTVAMQGERLRVNGKKRDELQEVIAFLKKEADDLELNFTNYRD
jgi:uncharacterized protein YajQ (UPF0234 family)